MAIRFHTNICSGGVKLEFSPISLPYTAAKKGWVLVHITSAFDDKSLVPSHSVTKNGVPVGAISSLSQSDTSGYAVYQLLSTAYMVQVATGDVIRSSCTGYTKGTNAYFSA